MEISRLRKAPKIIWGIIAAIPCGVLGFLLLRSLGFWICWEIVAAGLVALGCFGEWYMFKHPVKDNDKERHQKELQFIMAVTIGVTMEFLGLAHAIPEAARLEKKVAEAN